MTIGEHTTHFVGKSVEDYVPETGIADPINKIYRLRTEYDSEQGMIDLLARFLEDPRVSEISGIVIGLWDWDNQESSQFIVEALVAARDKLPNLKAIFLGDIIYEECEISWLVQSDISPLLAAYPQLEHLRVRGGDRLSLGSLRHDNLKVLVVESGGLNVNVVREVCQSHLPALEHLELWLGVAEYGGNTSVDDLQPILSGQLFPKLSYLGLRDSEIADEIAKALANALVLKQVKVLDLSLGTLTDEGAEALFARLDNSLPFITLSEALGNEGAKALLDNLPVIQLEKLDIHHHYVSDPVVAKLNQLKIMVDASDRQIPDEDDGEIYRYVAVSE